MAYKDQRVVSILLEQAELIEERCEGYRDELKIAVAELERKFIEHAMNASSGRVADAAHLLGVSRKGLFLKRRRAGLT